MKDRRRITCMKKDELFEILKRKLNAVDPDNGNPEELMAETVSEYLERLLLRGHIPAQFVESIEKDLQEEVTEMFRKKTYGHSDLKSYHQSQKSRTKSSKSRTT
jgi:hypothetical protein